LEVEFLGEFASIFENALADEPGDQLGRFGEITLDKKISRYCPFNVPEQMVTIEAQREKRLQKFFSLFKKKFSSNFSQREKLLQNFFSLFEKIFSSNFSSCF
jgi:hypothetical protein